MIKDLLQKIATVAHHHGSDENVIHQLEAKLEQLYQTRFHNNVLLLAYRNEFRVKYAKSLKIKKPRILLGQINYDIYPNFQSLPLLHFADVVSLSNQSSHGGRADRLVFDYKYGDLSEAVKQLPEGFSPDYFWDPQVCGRSLPPIGLEKLPFPSVAGICHTFRAINTLRLANLYDAVAPVSSFFVPFYQSFNPNCMVLDVPFGGNWGSFHYTTANSSAVRDIDFLVSFSGSERYEYGGWRDKAILLAEEFKEKYGDRFNVVFISGVSPDIYVKHLLRAKIALNVVGFNGPYNYRTCEIINHGAVLMQLEVEFEGFAQNLAKYLTPGKDFISVNATNFSSKLLEYLNNPSEIQSMASEARNRLIREYSYQSIHTQLWKQLATSNLGDRKSKANEQARNRLLQLSSAPPGHQHKLEVFIETALGQVDLSSSDSIRMAMLALSINGDNEILDAEPCVKVPALGEVLKVSYIQAMELLFDKLAPANLYDKWLLCCNKALKNMPVEMELLEIQKLLRDESTVEGIPDLNGWLAIGFNLPKNKFDESQQKILEYPVLQNAGNAKMQKTAIKHYMLWWVDFFQKSGHLKSE